MRNHPCLHVATAGKPAAAVARAIVPFAGGVVHVTVAHDDGCPCTTVGAPMAGCTCEIVDLTIRRAAKAAA